MEENPAFGLRLIGHSLGAGVAAVLGVMLRRQFPSLYCLCFSPPGCVFTSGIAAESKKFCCSFVLHDDLVPRLSFDSLVRLRNELVELIARIKVPKHCVFSTKLKPSTEQTIIGLPERLLHPRSNIPRSDFLREYERFLELQATRKDDRASITLTLPGHIMHCVRTSTSYGNTPCNCIVTCCKKIACCGSVRSTRFKARWVEPSDLSNIIVSPSMLVSDEVLLCGAFVFSHMYRTYTLYRSTTFLSTCLRPSKLLLMHMAARQPSCIKNPRGLREPSEPTSQRRILSRELDDSRYHNC